MFRDGYISIVVAASLHECMIHTINCMYSIIASWGWIACLFGTCRVFYKNNIPRKFISLVLLHNLSRCPVNIISNLINPPLCTMGRDSSVGIATRYALDDPGIESRWGEIFRTRPDRAWCPPSLLYNGYRVFPRGKATGAWCWPPTPI